MRRLLTCLMVPTAAKTNRAARGPHERLVLLLLVVLIAGGGVLRFSVRWLIIDQPTRADVILVLDGDSNDVRSQRASFEPDTRKPFSWTNATTTFGSARHT